MTIHADMNNDTKNMIKKAFIEQIEQLGFQRVTVKHIAQTAHINRGTFYLHYTDKYDLMEHVQNELIVELTKRVELVHPAAAFQHVISGQLYHPFVNIFQYIFSERPTFRALLGEHGDPSFRNKLKLIFSRVLLGKLTAHDALLSQPDFAPYVQAFMTSAILGIIEEWMDQKHEEQTAEEMARIHYRIMHFISHLSQNLQHNERSI